MPGAAELTRNPTGLHNPGPARRYRAISGGRPTVATQLAGTTSAALTLVVFDDDVGRVTFTGVAQTGAGLGTIGATPVTTELAGPTSTVPTIVAFDVDVGRPTFTVTAQTGVTLGTIGAATVATQLAGVTPAVPTIVTFEHELGRPAFPVTAQIGIAPGMNGIATVTTAMEGPIPEPPNIVEFGEIMRGVLLPVGSFRLVTGTVVDLEGEPIERAELLLADQWLLTSGPVDEQGNFQIRLMRTEYTNFRLLGPRERGEAPFDLVWFLGRDTKVRAGEDEDVELVFEVRDPPTGLVGGGTGSMVGGPLQS